MNVLVTGGGGFLGRHLIRELIGQGHRVVAPRSATVDLRRPGALAEHLGSHRGRGDRFDQIYHLATWTRAGGFCRQHAGDQWRVLQAMDAQVLGYWLEEQPEATLITLGTSVAYAPSLDHHPEDHYLSGEPSDAYFGYAMAKRALYGGARSIAQQHGLEQLHAVPSTLYGPDYHTDGRSLHFVYDLVRKILRGRVNGDEVVLWGDGHQRRELIDVRDAARWLHRLALKAPGWAPEARGLINLGAGTDHSIREIAHVICDAVGFDPRKICYDTSAFVGARAKCLATRRLDAVLPDRHCTPLADGLADTVAWAAEHLDALTPAEEAGRV